MSAFHLGGKGRGGTIIMQAGKELLPVSVISVQGESPASNDDADARRKLLEESAWADVSTHFSQSYQLPAD